MSTFLPAALRTWLLVIRRPGAFFREHEEAASPLAFAIVVYLAAAASAIVANLWALGHQPAALLLGGVGGLLLGGLGLLLWLGLGGALLHGGLRAVGVRGRPLRDTYACLCYASAPLVFLHIPYVGLVLGPLWTLALGFVGVRSVHGISRRRAVAALAVPVAGLSLVLLLGGDALASNTSGAGAAAAGLLAGDRVLVWCPGDGRRTGGWLKTQRGTRAGSACPRLASSRR
jgi:hypothetical protein